MSNTVNTTPPIRADWNAILGKIQGVAPDLKVSAATYDVETNNLTLTVGEGKSARTVVVELPELDAPDKVDQVLFSSLLSKIGDGETFGLTAGQLEEVKKVFEQMASTELPPPSGNALFDIYALMALMLKVAQEQRDASRLIRKQQSEAIQQSIQNQADAQRSAALTGMIAGLAVCAVQVVAQGVSAYKQMQGYTMDQAAMKDANLESTQKTHELAQQNFNTQSDKLAGMQKNHDLHQAKLDVRNAEQLVSSRQENLRTAHQDVRTAEARLTAAENRSAAAERAYNEAPEGEKALKLKELKMARAEQGVAKAELDAAKVRLEGASQDVSQATLDLDAATARHNEASAALRAEGKEYNPSEEPAYQRQREAVDVAAKDLETARQNASISQGKYSSDSRKIAGDRMQTKWRMLGDIFNSVGMAAQNTVRSATDILQSEATEESATQNRQEEERDQIKDLFHQGEDMVKAVLSLIGAVIQAEDRSMHDTFA